MGLDKDDIKQLIAILQRGLTDDDESDDDSVAELESTSVKKTKPKNKKKYTNLFDKMSESRMHKDDVEIDKKLSKPINVRCRVCGKTESINPSLVESVERYKCNKCSTSSG